MQPYLCISILIKSLFPLRENLVQRHHHRKGREERGGRLSGGQDGGQETVRPRRAQVPHIRILCWRRNSSRYEEGFEKSLRIFLTTDIASSRTKMIMTRSCFRYLKGAANGNLEDVDERRDPGAVGGGAEKDRKACPSRVRQSEMRGLRTSKLNRHSI